MNNTQFSFCSIITEDVCKQTTASLKCNYLLNSFVFLSTRGMWDYSKGTPDRESRSPSGGTKDENHKVHMNVLFSGVTDKSNTSFLMSVKNLILVHWQLKEKVQLFISVTELKPTCSVGWTDDDDDDEYLKKIQVISCPSLTDWWSGREWEEFD